MVDYNVRRVINHIRDHKLRHFNAREVRQKMSGSIRSASVMDYVCKVLVDSELIKPNFHRAKFNKLLAKNYDVLPLFYRENPR